MFARFKQIYFNRQQLSESEKQSSRLLSIFEGGSARTILTLTSGIYVVGFVKQIGVSDSAAALISAIPVFSGIAMLFSPMFFESVKNRKPIIAFLCLIGRMLLGSIIFIPFVFNNPDYTTTAFILVYLIANLLLSFTYPGAQAWIQNLTPENIKGKYFGKREGIVLAFVSIVSLFSGRILDIFKGNASENQGFNIIFSIVGIMAIINFLFMSAMKEQPSHVTGTKLKVIDTIRLSFKNREYGKILLFIALWNFCFQFSFPFTSVFIISELKINFSFISLVSVIGSISSVVFVQFWGKLADRKSWFFLIKIIIILQVLSFTFFIFANFNTYAMVTLAQIFTGAAAGGMNISIFNIQYLYSPKENKTVYLGLSSALSGVAGFIGTICGAWVIKIFNSHIATFNFGISGIQILFVFTSFMLMGCLLLLKKTHAQ